MRKREVSSGWNWNWICVSLFFFIETERRNYRRQYRFSNLANFRKLRSWLSNIPPERHEYYLHFVLKVISAVRFWPAFFYVYTRAKVRRRRAARTSARDLPFIDILRVAVNFIYMLTWSHVHISAFHLEIPSKRARCRASPEQDLCATRVSFAKRREPKFFVRC